MVAGIAVLTLGCASGGAPRTAPAVEPGPGSAAGDPVLADVELRSQRLFRVRYQSREGSGGLRLVLRLAATDRFSLSASDTLGRPVWSLGYADGETLIVDHKLKESCRTGADVRVPEAALAPLPIEMLPLVLLGHLPVTSEQTDGEVDLLDAQARRWTARMEDGRPLSWTLWSGGEPSLWWLAQSRGGVLSHRSGSQFRWRESVVEPLSAGAEALEPPAEYPVIDCEAWSVSEPRQDQPAPPGDRPSG